MFQIQQPSRFRSCSMTCCDVKSLQKPGPASVSPAQSLAMPGIHISANSRSGSDCINCSKRERVSQIRRPNLDERKGPRENLNRRMSLRSSTGAESTAFMLEAHLRAQRWNMSGHMRAQTSCASRCCHAM